MGPGQLFPDPFVQVPICSVRDQFYGGPIVQKPCRLLKVKMAEAAVWSLFALFLVLKYH